MVAINPAYAESHELRTASALAAQRSRPAQLPELIWRLHETLVNTATDIATAKRAKASLLRAVTGPDGALDTVVPPLPAQSPRTRRARTHRSTAVSPACSRIHFNASS